jgi:hypothetical protein
MLREVVFSALAVQCIWSTPEGIEELRGEGEGEGEAMYLCHPIAMHPATRTATDEEKVSLRIIARSISCQTTSFVTAKMTVTRGR